MKQLFKNNLYSGALSRPTKSSFLVLFTLEPLYRSIIVTVVPLMALERFGSAQDVSIFFFLLGILGVGMSLAVPLLVRRLARRGTFSLGVIAGVVSMLLFMHNELWAFCAGMALHLFAASCIDVTLNLYLMDHVRRQDFGRYEPVRMFFLAFSWSVGPFLGVYLRNAVNPAAPFLVGSVVLLLLGAYFFYLRFFDNPALGGQRVALTNPIRYLPRFFMQPRMTLVYLLSTMRSGWWTMYFIYVPIFCVTMGLGETMGGALVSLATSFVMTTPLLRSTIQRYGIRRVLLVGYSGAGLVTIGIGACMGIPYLAVALILMAALFAVLCDSVGNTLFYRAVRSWERSEMATVFGSYRSVSSLVFPGVYSGVLAIFPLPAVFVFTGFGMLATSLMTRFIPTRMR
ncbi:MAG: MFS transporter [Bacteroidetes Order II. Incertae sedis bacterium]|nr:MFS transporter [Bacteroidetes Order II. bacterium]